MIVYANDFYLEPREGDLDNLKRAIKRWLERKIGNSFRTRKIIPFAEPFRIQRDDTGANEVMIIGTPDSADDYSLSINYRHNDFKTQGRAWFTRIGIERPNPHSPLHVTILLETSEVSPQAALIPVKPSQPGIVQEILRCCNLDVKTPGNAVYQLDPASVDEFKKKVSDPHRFHALIVVSPDDFSEKPHVDIEQLCQRLIGLAAVYEISDKRKARELRDGLLPSFHTAWDGSVTVISPCRREGTAYGKVYRIGDIEAIYEDTGLSLDRYLFNDLTHRFNLVKSRRHIGDDVVSRRLVGFKLAGLKEKLGNVAGLDELVKSYEEDRDKAKQHSDELDCKLLEREEQIQKQQDIISELEKKVRTLQFHLNQISALRERSSEDQIESHPIPANLESIPTWVETEQPGRLIFTGRAIRTLKDSPFEDHEKVAKLFLVLVNGFFAAFRGDIQFQDAIQELAEIPARYSAKQSEITAGMKEGYECTHDGVKYSLQKHLGIGTSRDPRFCFRLYFAWEPTKGVIVVLHAGNHLDTQST